MKSSPLFFVHQLFYSFKGGARRRVLPAAVFLLGFLFLPCAPAYASSQWVPYIFSLQPYKGAQIFINGDKRSFRVLKREKSLAKVRVRVKRSEAVEGFELRLDKKGYRSQSRSVQWRPSTGKLFHRTYTLMPKGIPIYFDMIVKTGKQPKSVRFIDNHRVVIPLLDDNGIQLLDTRGGKLKDLVLPKRYARKEGFVESEVVPSRKEFWVSQMTTAKIHRYGLESLDYKGTIHTSGKWSKVLWADEAHDQVFLSHWLSHAISIIDLKTLKETRLVKMRYKDVPRGLVVSKRKKRLYVAEFKRFYKKMRYGRILSYDLKTMSFKSQFGPYGAKRHLALHSISGQAEKLYVSDMLHSRVEVYSLKREKLIKKIKVGPKPNTIALSQNNRYLFVSTRGPNNPKSYYLKGPKFGEIYVIDTQKDEVVYKWTTGNQPTGLAVSPDGKTLVTTDFLDFAVRVYRLDERFYRESISSKDATAASSGDGI